MSNLNRYFVIVILVVCIAAPFAAAQPIYAEDFSPPDPFDIFEQSTARWVIDNQADYGPKWAYKGWDPGTMGSNALNLPFPDWNSIYFFTNGYKRLWTTDTTENSSVNYAVWHDFIIKGSTLLSDLHFGQYIQRQAQDPAQCYLAAFVLNNSGQVSWIGNYGFSGYASPTLTTDTWYTMLTEIEVTPAAVTMQSKILLLDYQSPPTTLHTSPVFTDTSEGRYNSAHGYGLFLSLPGTRYWTQSIEYDNFIVDIAYNAPDAPQPPHCGDDHTMYLPGDISGAAEVPDCVIDLFDFAKFAEYWLLCTDPADPENCDLGI